MIRKGCEADLDRAVELLRDAHEAAALPLPFERKYAERLFFHHLVHDRAFCGIFEVRNRPEGILLATWFEHPFGPVKVAKETLWWIDPAHRGRGAMRMLKAYETWADDKGCGFVGMAGIGPDPEVSKLYERRGYRVAETHFLKPLKV